MEKESRPLKGLKGWLLFILIIFILSAVSKFFTIIGFIFQPILLNPLKNNAKLGQLIEKIEPNTTIQIISVILALLSLIILVITIYHLIKNKEKAKKLAIITLWVLFIGSLFSHIISIISLPSTLEALKELSPYTGEMLKQTKTITYISRTIGLGFSVGWTIVWSLYFFRSKRVKNTLTEK